MVEIKIDRKQGKMLMTYPAASGMKDEVVAINSNRDAMGIWRLRIRSYVMNTMMAYYKNRQYALAKVMTAERQLALLEIREVMLANYEGKDLRYFLKRVMKLSRDVVAVAPGKDSKHLDYYETVILPMYHWINAFLKKGTSL